MGILDKDRERLKAAYATLKKLPADSKAKTELLTEYKHYLQ